MDAVDLALNGYASGILEPTSDGWNLSNTERSGGTAGEDINVEKAWDAGKLDAASTWR